MPAEPDQTPAREHRTAGDLAAALAARVAALEEALAEANDLLLQAADALAEAGVRPMLEEDLENAVERYGDLLGQRVELPDSE